MIFCSHLRVGNVEGDSHNEVEMKHPQMASTDVCIAAAGVECLHDEHNATINKRL